MEQRTWKRRIAALPVVGGLVAGIRGVFTLRVWRAQLRADIAALRDQLARRDAGLDARFEALRDLQAESFERLAAEQRTEVAALAQLRERQSVAGAVIEARINAAETRLLARMQDWRGLSVRAAFDADVPPAAAEPRAAGLTESSAGAWSALGAELAPFADIAAGFEASATVCHLPADESDGWAQALRARPGTAAMLVASDGAQALDERQTRDLLEAALTALRPDGVVVLQYANPENALVAAALLRDGTQDYPRHPDTMARWLREAGFGHVDIRRLDADDEDCRLPGDGPAMARLNQLLFGPRRFAVVGCKIG